MASVREMLCHLWKSMVVLITSMKQLKGTRTWLSNVAVITKSGQCSIFIFCIEVYFSCSISTRLYTVKI